jgi:hypothetical protein
LGCLQGCRRELIDTEIQDMAAVFAREVVKVLRQAEVTNSLRLLPT